MATSVRNKPLLGLALVGLLGSATALPSGPASAQDRTADAAGPAQIIAAQAENVRFTSALDPAEVGPIQEVNASELKGTQTFDGAVRVIGDITNTWLHLTADHVEVMGGVKGENIFIHARSERDRDASRPHQAVDNTGTITIHGDVELLDGQIGAPGTSSVIINGHVAMLQQSQTVDRGGGFITAQNVCVTGDYYNQNGGLVLADNFTVGRDLLGGGMRSHIYTQPGADGIYPGRTLVGRNFNMWGANMTNGEISVGGDVNARGVVFSQQRSAQPVTEQDLDCGTPNVGSIRPVAERRL